MQPIRKNRLSMKKITTCALLLTAAAFLLASCVNNASDQQKKPVSVTQDEVTANKAAGEAFMAQIATQEGVGRTASGLCYRVVENGSGEVPTAHDKVIVHYRGTLIDGTVFDSSYDRGTPAVFGVSDVIPGWTEALCMMPVDSKWILYIPQQLAYGSQRVGKDILPYSAMIFEVELLGIVKD